MEQESLVARGSIVVENCDMGWLKIELNKYPMFMSLTNRKKKKVYKCILQIINSDDPRFYIRYDLDLSFLEALTTLINTTRNQLHLSRLFLSGDTMVDPSVCFKSETASSTRITKLFCLLPNFNLKRKFVTFNPGEWRHVLRACGIAFDYDSRAERGIRRIEEDAWSFYQTLYFDKVGLGNSMTNLERYNFDDPPEDRRFVFNNMIRTDGHTIEFLFAARKSEFDALPNLTMPDLSDENFNQFHVYGIDLGHRHLLTAVDVERQDNEPTNQNCVRFSNNEWYAKAGVLKRRYLQQQQKDYHGISAIESDLPSRKTSNPESFAYCCQDWFDNLNTLTSFYGSSFTKDRFLAYNGQQKMANEVVNLFVNGGNKYEHRIRDE
jgi:hypothetical protein